MSNRELFSVCIELLRKAADAPQQLVALRKSLETAADEVIREHVRLGIVALEEVAERHNRIEAAIPILESGELNDAMKDVDSLLFELSDCYLDAISTDSSERLVMQLFGAYSDTPAGKLYDVAGKLNEILYPEGYDDP